MEVSLEQLTEDPHPLLARLREREPVCWVPALEGWLVTRHDLVTRALRDSATFTVDDPRFSTARLVGPSMLSRDGAEHARHRSPFVAAFRSAAVHGRFAAPVQAEARRLIGAMAPAGGAELRRSFAGPLAAAIIGRALGLADAGVEAVLGWYDAIVGGVTAITAGQRPPPAAKDAFAELREQLLVAIGDDRGDSLLGGLASRSQLSAEEVVSDAAVLLFGGIETTEGMIANAVLLLVGHPEELERARARPDRLDGVLEESLRLEPAAAVVDRYCTADAELGGARIRRGELVRLSISAANRDPAVFQQPDRFLPERRRSPGHLAFAQGPHVCLGVHLARLEARVGLSLLLAELPGLRCDPQRPARVRGLVFRKPPRLDVLWS